MVGVQGLQDQEVLQMGLEDPEEPQVLRTLGKHNMTFLTRCRGAWHALLHCGVCF